MAASTPPVGLDHPTVVPTNFEREDESDEQSGGETGPSSGDDGEMSQAECR
ncbi:MAG: hypothetical protein J07HX64_01047 [halophilic archaeon J07HX64]|nr:MAG: hypothetical protein J07HX64_01047 [halophilic archaeon J07HX64]